MTVLLDQDRLQPVQVHLNELTWRVTVLFASIALLTAVWVMVVDEVLIPFSEPKPCAGDCLNVYDPAQWSAVQVTLLLAASHTLIAFHVLHFQTGLVAQRIHIATTMDDHHRFCPIVVVFLLVATACTVRCDSPNTTR